ncbi:MAG: Na(+)/H(+) antiporter subunit C [Varibaculum cambriense]|uniref:Na(+)/H(+) antiporter subunit C n=1 Tax=Varibaculum cambriense TaxID=184870 RepID=UPI00290D1386|nr:Na(+)/H(+) antiporter subunit C [Varibaculum cambriense]MDU4026924.1 Na(+)/H(+) antiporter subunit C [Varibaculum cambriense]
MSVSLCLLLAAGFLVACGVYLVTERTLTRIVIGLGLLGNGIILFLLSQGGRAGTAPILGTALSKMSDPLPQGMILTAIVLSMATTAFGLALAYRSWRLSGHDEVTDDLEDRRLAKKVGDTERFLRLDLDELDKKRGRKRREL